MSKKKTFMFIYSSLEIGGIETYLIRLIRKLRETGNRVIWLAPINRRIDEGFKEEILDGYVEIINIGTKIFSWIDCEEILFAKDEEVTALAFDPINYLRLETIKKKYNNVAINSIYWVPHFKGRAYFIEDYVVWPLRKIIKNIMSNIIVDMERNNNIYYLNKSHANAYMERYNYKIEDLDSKLSKGNTRTFLPLDKELILERSLSEEFNIISVGRFVFPHKAYIIGLIRTYGNLKLKYDKLKLTIIGYGEDEDKVKQEVNKLPVEIQNSISLVGKVKYDKLDSYYRNANLNIGVASTIAEGALTGLISIPVRHYCFECEGYGYLPESKNKTTSNEPGIPIKKFIDEVMNMDQDTYYKYSKKSYDAYTHNNSSIDITSILEFKNKNPKKTISKIRINKIKNYSIFVKIIQTIEIKTQRLFKNFIKRI